MTGEHRFAGRRQVRYISERDLPVPSSVTARLFFPSGCLPGAGATGQCACPASQPALGSQPAVSSPRLFLSTFPVTSPALPKASRPSRAGSHRNGRHWPGQHGGARPQAEPLHLRARAAHVRGRGQCRRETCPRHRRAADHATSSLPFSYGLCLAR